MDLEEAYAFVTPLAVPNMTSQALTNVTTEDPRIREVKMVVHGCIVPSICLIGMVLNVINFIVLRDKRLKESCYTYLVGLAVADFLSLLMFGINGIGRGHYAGEYKWRIFETFVYFPVCLTATSASVFLIVTVTAERFVFLYWPIPSRMWCTRPVARKIVAAVCVLAVLLNSPRFFVFYVTEDGEMMSTKFGMSTFYKILTWFLFFLLALGCGVILIVFNALLIKGIHNANERRRSMRSSTPSAISERKDEVRLTRTLISVIFLYLIGEIPSSIFSRVVFGSLVGKDVQLNTLWYEICVSIATIFVVCQHSLNFVFYCVFNKRFYQIFRNEFLVCKKPCQDQPLNSELATVVHDSLDQSIRKNSKGIQEHSESNGTSNKQLMYQPLESSDPKTNGTIPNEIQRQDSTNESTGQVQADNKGDEDDITNRSNSISTGSGQSDCAEQKLLSKT